MMRGESSMATAVRNAEGKIVIESSRFTPAKEKSKIYRVPIIRGVINFVNSMISGIKLINRSGEVFGDVDEAPSKFEKWLAKTFKVDIMNVVIVIGAVFGILLSLGLFVVLPQLAATGIFSLAKLDASSFKMSVLYNFIAGAVRMLIFILYLVLVSLMKDIKRLFKYHGAEHRTISCYENGLELTVENVQTQTTVHDRCGTTFMFIVMVFSILFFSVFPVELLAGGGKFVNFILRILSRIIMIPIVAGISYELLKLFARYDNVFTRICKQPGLWLQKLTTKIPDDEMAEVAIAAFNEVLKLEADKDYPTKSFDTSSTVEKLVSKYSEQLKSENEAELILMKVTGAKTETELYDGRRVSGEQTKESARYVKNRLTGAPLQYVLGETCFYGLDLKCDARALIPRFDTEVVAEAVIDRAKTMENPKILDLCTGSGAIALAVKANCEAEITATDVSRDAVELCKENVALTGLSVEVRAGSMFMPVRREKFDIIVSNPPYIQSAVVPTLDKEVAEYEPRLALDGGADGLDFYRDIAKSAKKHLNRGGYLILEAGMGQAELIKEMLIDDYDVEFIKDLNNPPIDRAVVAKIKDEAVSDEETEKTEGEN